MLQTSFFLQSLLDHDADVNAVDEEGNTALHLVCGDKTSFYLIPDGIKLLVSQANSYIGTPDLIWGAIPLQIFMIILA